MKRKYSYSAISSVMSAHEEKTAQSALRALQQERLIVSRLGFPEKAFELDRQIDLIRGKVKAERDKEEAQLVEQRMKMLAGSHARKRMNLERQLHDEKTKLEKQYEDEEADLLGRHERDFLALLEGATRRAIGRVKKCNCQHAYLCKHNKTTSYNTRRPTKLVVQYRRNAKRLKHGGRAEESTAWEEKANELDQQEQEEWREKVARHQPSNQPSITCAAYSCCWEARLSDHKPVYALLDIDLGGLCRLPPSRSGSGRTQERQQQVNDSAGGNTSKSTKQ